ncbi:MAG: 3-phosphoglycerate dehydrogenase [Deltaproteobacteria bacterium]|nr:3-phosphoglycerate dehydrogenase [Deltaproteobacteria bacterium]MCB9788427.1 3-phosphoglycerate dehydrogenase [Deltaproteobacteria bacterium]
MTLVRDGKHTYRHWNGRFQRALIIENPDPLLDERLREMGIEPHRVADAPDEDELVRLLQEGQHHLIFKRSKVEITERVVAASENLAAVMLCCIGDDSVDKVACARSGVLVTHDPVSNGRSVAELVMGELIAIARRLFESVPEMANSEWNKGSQGRYELMGKRLGILGLGNIGRQVAQLGQALGMEIVFFDTAPVPREVGLAMGWRPVSNPRELFALADFVSVHVSATDIHGRSNRGLVTYEMLSAMSDKPGESPRAFINLARGFIVDPDVLRRAVTEGHVAYAMTDVFPEEPGRASTTRWINPYQGEPRIFATPHIGAATREAQPRIAAYVSRTTQMLNEMGMLRNCVFRTRAAIEFDVDFASSMLAVVHVDKRGTKKAVDDAIFKAGANNLRSAHIDFPDYGIAYDLSALDRELTPEQITSLLHDAAEITGDPTAIRWLRSIPLEGGTGS